MGTRGAVGFRFRETDKLSYNHWDSYPTGLGVSAVNTVRKWNDEQLAGAANRIELVSESRKPTNEQVKAYSKFANLTVGGQSTNDWYCLLRDAQGKLDPYIDGQISHMIDASGFMGNSLFCEWAYVINLDERTLEIYRGFNKNPDANGRYAKLWRVERPNEYCGVRLVTAIPFDTIRGLAEEKVFDFCRGIEEATYEAEEREYEMEAQP